MNPEDFLEKYSSALQSQKWTNVESLFHSNASVTFSNGEVHTGRSEIKAAFTKNFTLIKNEKYLISDVNWLVKNKSTAVFQFKYSWRGLIKGKQAEGGGVGTSVLIRDAEKWLLLTEHLGKIT